MSESESDIVERLRGLCVETGNDWIGQAADEVEEEISSLRTKIEQLADEVERMRVERDSARQEIVMLLAPTIPASMVKYAESRGWDCFKEVG